MEYGVWSILHSVRSMASGVGAGMLWKRVISIIIITEDVGEIRDDHAKPTARGIDKAF